MFTKDKFYISHLSFVNVIGIPKMYALF